MIILAVHREIRLSMSQNKGNITNYNCVQFHPYNVINNP